MRIGECGGRKIINATTRPAFSNTIYTGITNSWDVVLFNSSPGTFPQKRGDIHSPEPCEQHYSVVDACDPMLPTESKFGLNVLSLDGGGSKGIYSLGVLTEVEAAFGAPLCDHFGLMYGTSTGAIIASMLALGMSVSAIRETYLDLIPKVMGHRKSADRSSELRKQATSLFGGRKFDSFKCSVGVVATNYDFERPFIFKNSQSQAFTRHATFEPGFGCTISEALVASCAAFPFFQRPRVKTLNQGTPELMDGGFSANNPTLFAVADALQALRMPRESIRVLSVGVGHFNEPQRTWYSQIIMRLWPFQMIQKQFAINTNTVETLRRLFFSDIACIRIDESFPDARYATDLLETDHTRLMQLFQLGRNSFAEHEVNFRKQFNL